MIHVCLLSCDRFDYTLQTAISFLEHNAEGFTLWHCDDASTDLRLRSTVQALGFRPLVYTHSRIGVTAMVRRTATELQAMGAEWMLLLENDWETVRPFPWQVFEAVKTKVWAIRLYGQYKARDKQRPVSAHHQGRNKADPGWQAYDGYEIGQIHWGNPPSVSRVKDVVWLHEGASSERDAILKSGRISDRVARVTDNVVYHIGEEHTPGFVP
jgi:hypothetical protein